MSDQLLAIPRLTIDQALEDWNTGDRFKANEEWQPVDTLLKNNPRAPWAVCYRVQDLWSSQQGRSVLLLIGPDQTLQNLEQAQQYKHDMELISTTKWPVWYIDNPYYEEVT